MEVKQSTTILEYNPFPRNSVNLVVGPTHIGKSFFITRLLNNYKKFFPPPVKRIFIVLCNERVQPLKFDSHLEEDDNVTIEQVPLDEFIPDNLRKHDLVVIDDLQTLTTPLRLTISVCAHHYDLVSLFVITHSLVGSPNFELVNYCHRLFLFLSASTNAGQVAFILNHYYKDLDTKNYLKSVLGFCQSEKEVLALEFNPLASQPKSQQVVLAFSHLTTFLDKGYFFVYPYPHWGKEYTQTFEHSVVEKMTDSFDYPEGASNFPVPTFVAVPVNVVLKAKASKNSSSSSNNKQCSEKSQWEETNGQIEENIEHYFPPVKWQKIKNLAREILGNAKFCVKTDGKTFHLKDKPRTEVSLVDFLAVATRRAAPMEKDRDPIWKVYSMHVETLLANNAPKDLIKNRLLIPKKFQ